MSTGGGKPTNAVPQILCCGASWILRNLEGRKKKIRIEKRVVELEEEKITKVIEEVIEKEG